MMALVGVMVLPLLAVSRKCFCTCSTRASRPPTNLCMRRAISASCSSGSCRERWVASASETSASS
jgi:hypothetical protein